MAADPVLVAAISGVAGTAVGASATILSGWISSRSAARLANSQRNQSARELAAKAFAAARSAVASLHPSLVQNLDALPLSDATSKRYAVRSRQLEEALASLDQVAALLAARPTGRTAAAVARELVVFDDAWRNAISHGSLLHASIPPKEYDLHTQEWSSAAQQLRSSRETLLGYAALTYSEEAGTELAGLLGQLAESVGSEH